MYGGAVAPAGWLICNGGSYSATTYSALFGAIGTTYGGSGGFFNVPDFRSKVSRGLGPTAPYNALGNTGGADSVTLTANNIPAHVHPITDPGHAHDVVLTKGYDADTYAGVVNGSFSYIGMSEGNLGSRWTDPAAAVTTTTGITSTNPSVSPNNSCSGANSCIVLNFIIKT